jgi:hypothetical protein
MLYHSNSIIEDIMKAEFVGIALFLILLFYLQFAEMPSFEIFLSKTQLILGFPFFIEETGYCIGSFSSLRTTLMIWSEV